MKTYQKLIACCFLLPVLSCQNLNDTRNQKESTTDSTGLNIISSSAAIESKDPTRKFIRTANLKFKAKDVIKATYNIEDIINRQDGFVINTNLQSEVDRVETIPVSADSTLETSYINVSNTLTVRIPNSKLDATLKEIANNVDFLDYRIIKADDVALQLLSNDLLQKRNRNNEQRLIHDIDSKEKKLEQTINGEETVLARQTQADQAMLSNLSLQDQIEYSTVNLSIYQRVFAKREVISSNKNVEPYQPGFANRFVEATMFGWEMLQSLVLFVVRFWAIILLGATLYFALKIYKPLLTKTKLADPGSIAT